MNKIKKCLGKEFGLKVERGKEHLFATDETVRALVTIPHEGNEHKWLVRFSTAAAFDRWANSTVFEMKFDTETDAVKYLTKNQMTIYRCLLDYLSSEYEDLYCEAYGD